MTEKILTEKRMSLPPQKISEPISPRIRTAPRSARNQLRIDFLRESTRKGFDKIHARRSQKQFYLLDKDYYDSQRLEKFAFDREISLQQKQPKRIKDEHTLEKIVSRRRMELSRKGKRESLPAIDNVLSPRIPLPKEAKAIYPRRTVVFYWG